VQFSALKDTRGVKKTILFYSTYITRGVKKTISFLLPDENVVSDFFVCVMDGMYFVFSDQENVV